LTVSPHTSLCRDAEGWAHSLWKEAESRWVGRGSQDRSYRYLAVYPFLFSVIRMLRKRNPLTILDLGCGDGSMLDDERFRELVGDDCRYLGVDVSGMLLDTAQKHHQSDNISFCEKHLTDPDLVEAVTGNGAFWNCVVAVFVIQEIPDLQAFLRNISRILSPESVALFVTVHPDFADWLLEQGRIRPVESLAPDPGDSAPPWRWAGGYPILDEPDEPFLVPHFQRTTDDYTALIESAGLKTDLIAEIPNHRELADLVAQGMSPFKPFPANVYWPRIGEHPSSLGMIVRKGEPDA